MADASKKTPATTHGTGVTLWRKGVVMWCVLFSGLV
jgi:hypothetical protein